MTHSYQTHIDQLCKPPGSLGEIEGIARRLCEIQQTNQPETHPRHCTIFAADHGVTVEGVSAWPSEVTASVVELMQHGRTASGVFSKTLNCRFEVVDVGMLRTPTGPMINASVRLGTRNLLHEPAMTEDDFEQALAKGRKRAALAINEGARILIGGEMGIGNTTSATCLIALICGVHDRRIVGRGAGIDDNGFIRKCDVIERACQRVRSLKLTDARAIACQVGGLEIVALAGFYLEASQQGIAVLLDGLISTASAVLANGIDPSVSRVMIAGHKSVEPGHMAALNFLGLQPLVDLRMRLGEATGALAALPLLDLAAAACCQMATLEDLQSR